MDISKMTAQNIRRIRESKKLTLDAAATITGVSRSMLSQIERGDANPTITVLWKIANGFKVSFTSLIEAPLEKTSVIKADAFKPMLEDEGRYINCPVFLFDEKRLFEMYRIIIKPNGKFEAQPHIVGTEEYITVFSGSLTIRIEGQEFQLSEGDSIRFRSDVPHTYYNPECITTQLSMLIYYAENAGVRG